MAEISTQNIKYSFERNSTLSKKITTPNKPMTLVKPAAPANDTPIGELAKSKYFLLFFFDSKCPHCQDFAPVVKKIEEKYGFTVIPFSFDGIGLPNYEKINYVTPKIYNTYYQTPKPFYPVLILQNSEDMSFYPVANGAGSLEQVTQMLNKYADAFNNKETYAVKGST